MQHFVRYIAWNFHLNWLTFLEAIQENKRVLFISVHSVDMAKLSLAQRLQSMANYYSLSFKPNAHRKINWIELRWTVLYRRRAVTAVAGRRSSSPVQRTADKIEAQPSQRDRATLLVIEYFAKSLKVIRNDTVEYGVPISIPLKLWLYVVPFLRYSASKNGMTLKSGVWVVQRHWKRRRSIDYIRLTISRPL